MKTQQELQLHYWGPLYNMVKEYNAKHGCDVKPWECVKYENENTYTEHPPFRNDNTEDYTFALTILYDDKRSEHRPVFVGDKVYTYEEYRHFIVSEGSTYNNLIVKRCPEGNLTNLHLSHASWNPPTPKRTFKLEFTEEEFKHLCDITSNWYSRYGTTIKEKITAARDKE